MVWPDSGLATQQGAFVSLVTNKHLYSGLSKARLWSTGMCSPASEA